MAGLGWGSELLSVVQDAAPQPTVHRTVHHKKKQYLVPKASGTTVEKTLVWMSWRQWLRDTAQDDKRCVLHAKSKCP